jgi:hypothetical protein
MGCVPRGYKGTKKVTWRVLSREKYWRVEGRVSGRQPAGSRVAWEQRYWTESSRASGRQPVGIRGVWEQWNWIESSPASGRQPVGIRGVWEQNWVESRRVEFRDASLSGAEELNWFENNGKTGVRLWNEDFMCDLKLQWECYKSVARIRLVKTENPTACSTVNCRIVIALYCL